MKAFDLGSVLHGGILYKMDQNNADLDHFTSELFVYMNNYHEK